MTPARAAVADRLNDALRLPEPAEVEPRGLFGERLRRCREYLLLAKDEEELLAGFLHRPGSHPWIGEHVGKWLDAACGELERTNDERLREKVERVAAKLRSAQTDDGYLGTYEPSARWTEWDVWVHKYVLIGLLAHHRACASTESLLCARRVGELLVRTFQDRSIDLVSPRVSAHVGMAAGSVLGPVVRLWRATGDERFLDFARFVAARLEGESGPRVASSLRAGRGVHEVANGKAYEMLSVLCGRLDLARATGEEEIADAATVAFEDIVKHHLYVTGGLSFEEYFRAPATAPSTGDVSETCALVTWMQLCAELFKLTGERRFLAPFERAAWNHLLAAQRPDGAAFCYFTPLAGRRIHRTDLTCCGSSGPRGLALVPQLIFAVRAPSQVEVHLLIDAHAKLAIEGGHAELTLSTNFVSPAPDDYPRRAKLVASTTAACDLVVHAPTWARRVTFHGSAPRRLEGGADDAFRVRLEPGAARNFSLEVHELASRFEMGRGRESGRQARLLGPLVLARSAGSGEVARPDGTRELPHVPFFMPSPDESPLAVWQEPAS